MYVITDAEFSVYDYIRSRGKSISQIAFDFEVPQSEVRTLVERLAALGLLRRSKSGDDTFCRVKPRPKNIIIL